MGSMIVWRITAILAAALAIGSQALAQTSPQTKLTGLINDYTPALDASGPWQVMGEWSLTVDSVSGQVDFVASLNMVRSESAARAAHTHHLKLSDGQVTAIANGYRISGTAYFTSNGSLAGFSGSPVNVEITGSSTLPFANVALTVGGAAVAHFGPQQLHGVVTYEP